MLPANSVRPGAARPPHSLNTNPTNAPTSVGRRVATACAAYFVLHLAAHLSAGWFEVSKGVSIWYPPAGLALSLLLLIGPRYAPVVFAANTVGAMITPGIAAWWDPWLFPASITAIVATVAWAVRRVHQPILLPGSARETALFAGVTIATPGLLAISGTAIASSLGLVPAHELSECVIRWWVGDASGILTTLPVCMVFAASWLQLPGAPLRALRCRPRTIAIFLSRLAALVACLWGAFWLDPHADYSTFFLTFLPLVWISMRHGVAGATAATLLLTMGSLVGLHVTEASMPQVISFLVFELTVAVVGLGIGATVTRRDAAEARVIESEARLERVLTGAHLGLWDWSIPTGAVTYNQRCADILGLPFERLHGVEPSWQEFAHPVDRPKIAQALAAHLDGRSALYEADFRVRTRSGDWRWIHSRGSIVARDANGDPITVSGTHLDITDRMEAEAEARRLTRIIEVTTDFVLTTDLEGRIVHANASLLRQLGRPTLAGLRGRVIDEILPPETVAMLRHDAIPTALRTRSWIGEAVLRDSSGRITPVSLVVLLHHGGVDERELLSFTMRDLSQQKATEAERVAQERRLHQLQKNESLGVLAGGVAHDFNNLLTTVLGNANLLRLDLPPDAPHQDSLAQIETAATRAGELCQLMLAYAGRAPLHFTDINVSAVVEETRDLLFASLDRPAEVGFELTPDLPPVHGARAQIQQVLLNLVVNAVQAIGEARGRVTVRTRLEHLRVHELAGRSFTHPLVPGDHVVLEVEDNGPGMSDETRTRIFEPFFTTKFTGHGLGLAAAHGIVRSHEGAIEVVSAEGRGSIFRVYLPTQHATALAARSPERPGSGPAHRGLALVVDDEPGVRRTATRLMQSLGYETIGAIDGEDGVEQFRRSAERLAIVLLDVTMPRLDGEAALAQMRAIRPSVPVVMMSGYSERLTRDRFSATRPTALLPKPFDRNALLAALDAARQDAPATPASP